MIAACFVLRCLVSLNNQAISEWTSGNTKETLLGKLNKEFRLGTLSDIAYLESIMYHIPYDCDCSPLACLISECLE